jgi:hypothetical protein
MKLDFIIGGGVASGTSFLSSTLVDHPDIYISKIQRPEPNFYHYSWKFNRGVEWYKNQWFSDQGSQSVIGERSSLLLTSEVAPERIASLFPKIKLVFCLRNPIERAWANYRFTVLEGLESMDFADAIAAEEKRMKEASESWAEVQPHAYVYRSRYADGIKRYFKFFSKEQILFLKSETLSAEPVATLNRVCDFLGVRKNIDFTFPVNFTSPTVIDKSVQVKLRAYFGDRFSEMVEYIRKGQSFDLEAFKGEDLMMLNSLKANLGTGKEALLHSDRILLTDLLADDIAETSKLVDFSVESWV